MNELELARELEATMNGLLEETRAYLTKENVESVGSFTYHGEIQIAISQLAWILSEAQVEVPDGTRARMRSFSIRMDALDDMPPEYQVGGPIDEQ